MNLSTALRLEPHDVVAFVGGGGKTTSMFRLAAEIVAGGGQVVTTTTTRIFAAQIELAPRHVVVHDTPETWPSALAEIAAALAEGGHVLAIGPVEAGSGKAPGVPLGFIAQLQALPGGPTIVIEADGARMRPFKAPAEHEPVIPPETTVVVPVVGADVFGAALDEVRVHRPERVAQLAVVALGATVTPTVVAAVLAHAEGGMKNVPVGARVVVLINKLDKTAALDAARATAALLLRSPRIGTVALGAVASDTPVREAWGNVAAVVLAAGRSTRMGQPKQLLPWGATTLLGEVVARLQRSGVNQVVVVTGHKQAAVEAAAFAAAQPGGPPVTFAHNPDYAQSELARSLQAGLAALPDDCQALLVVLADQPYVDPAVIARLLERWRATRAPVVAPFFGEQRGHPMLFDRALWPAIRALPPQANPRQLLQSAGQIERVAVETEAILLDLDTPEAYAAALARRKAD